MQALLQKQTNLLSSLEENSKQVKDLSLNIKTLNERSVEGLNSNVIRLFKEMKKMSEELVKSRELNKEETDKITGEAGGRRQFDTLKPRAENFKEGFKDFLTLRGFMDKTRIAPRGAGDIVSEHLDRREARKNYVDQRLKTQGTTFGSAETFGRQFDEQQRIQGDIGKNEKEIQKLRDSGATEIGLKRSGLLEKRTQLASDLAKVDPRLRPEGFDARTGKVKDKPQNATEQQAKATAEIIPFTGAATPPAGVGAGVSEEAMLEQNRMVAQQTSLLTEIEENTRALKGGLAGAGSNQQPAAAPASGGPGVMDLLGSASGRLGNVAKTAGKGLMSGVRTAGSFLAARAGPLAAIGAVGAGAYAGYQGFSAASDKQEAAKEEIKSKVASGEITQGEAAQLTKKVDEKATVEKGGAVGKGTGMVAGGVGGALKGAAAGAALGSVVPVVGTVIGGAIGAGLGAVGGSVLGGKAGEWVGEKAGAAKNWVGNLFGSKKQEAAVAPGTKTADALTKTAQGVSGTPPERVSKIAGEPWSPGKDLSPKQLAVMEQGIAGGANYSFRVMEQYDKQKGNARAPVTGSVGTNASSVAPVPAAQTGNIIAKQSGDNEQAKMDATKGGNNTAIVAAPTVNNNQTVQNTPIKLPPRNTDSTINKYMQSRWAY